jgi:hypothetical protein
MGQVAEAQAVLAELRAERPDFTLDFVRRTHLYRAGSPHFERYLEGLRKAGVS